MAQVLDKIYPCLSCHEDVKISKIDNPPAGQHKKWERYNLDGSSHVCKSKNKKKEDEQEQSQKKPTSRGEELASIRAQLQILVMRLERLETADKEASN